MTDPSEFRYTIVEKSGISRSDASDIAELLIRIWPLKRPYSMDEEIDKIAAIRSPEFNLLQFIRDGQQLIGYTEVFQRDVMTAGRRIKNLALSGVCVHPEYRGRHLGAKLVRRAFGYVDDRTFACAIYQTSVPRFYEKLGAKRIQNRFFNSMDASAPEKWPWWDPHIMLYPASFELGDAPVDLRGPGY